MKAKIKVGILTGGAYRSPRILAEGLCRMLPKLDVECDVLFHGIDWIQGFGAKSSWWNGFRKQHLRKSIARKLGEYDLFVISWYTPNAFSDGFDLSPLRTYGRPILQYEVYFLGGNGYWQERLPSGVLDRYDGYLVASAVHEHPVTSLKPVFQVGMDLKPVHSFLQQREEFVVLFDFARKGYESERELQWAAVNELGLKTLELSGEYTFSEIEALYRRTNLGFVAHYEAFGVPIVQLQDYGALIASPQSSWVSRHALVESGASLRNAKELPFSSNFVFYHNYEDLKARLRESVSACDPRLIRSTLHNVQPHFVSGDLEVLRCAIQEFT